MHGSSLSLSPPPLSLLALMCAYMMCGCFVRDFCNCNCFILILIIGFCSCAPIYLFLLFGLFLLLFAALLFLFVTRLCLSKEKNAL